MLGGLKSRIMSIRGKNVIILLKIQYTQILVISDSPFGPIQVIFGQYTLRKFDTNASQFLMSINIRSLEKLQNLKFNPIKQNRMPKITTNGIGQKSQYSISYISKVQTFFEKLLLDFLLLPTIAMENSIHFFGAFRKGNVTRLTRCAPALSNSSPGFVSDRV